MITAPKTFRIATTLTALLVLSVSALTAAETNATRKIDKADAAIAGASQIPPEMITRKTKPDTPCLAMSADNVLYELKQKQKLTLVDVRRAEEFARLNIPGSVNIPIFAIKSKSFLKSSPIILVNEGYGYRNLEQEVRRLTMRGFQVSILDGGLPAWKRKGGQLSGDIFALEDMKNISPQVFFKEKDNENALVVDISPQRTEASSQLLPDAKHLPILDDSGGSMLELRQLVSKYKNKSFFSVLIFNASGKHYTKAEKILDRMKLDAVYLLGGFEGYQNYLEGLQLSWKPRDNRMKTVSNCKPCGQKEEEE